MMKDERPKPPSRVAITQLFPNAAIDLNYNRPLLPYSIASRIDQVLARHWPGIFQVLVANRAKTIIDTARMPFIRSTGVIRPMVI